MEMSFCISSLRDGNRQSLPGHAAVNGKVEGIGEANDAVYEEYDVPNKVVIKKILINSPVDNIFRLLVI